MKPSGIDWIGDIPESWKVKPLKYLAKCNQDVLLETTAPDYSFRYVDIGSVTYENGITEYQELRFEDCPSRARRRVSVGDTIISTVRTYLKAIAIISDSENVIVSTGFAVYTPDKAIYPRYLYYFCKSEGFVQEIDKNSYGIAYPAINTDLLSRICIAYPCYEDQQAIADFLDKECAKIDSIAADLEKQIALLQQYKKSLITETVTKGLDKSVSMKDSGVEWASKIPCHWEIKRFKYLCEYITDGSHFSPETTDEGYPYITAADVKGVGLDYDAAKKISQQDFISLQKAGCQPRKSDVLLVKDGATTGRIGMVTSEKPCVVLSSVAILRAPDNMDARYLRYLMESDFVQAQIQASMAGSAMPRTVLSKIINYWGITCPKEEQKEICDFLDRKCGYIETVIETKQVQQSTIQQHKKSLIYEYVTGKKRVKEVQ